MPSPRRKAAAAKSDVDEERGLAMRILLHSPKDLLAGSLAFAAVGAIVANAMFMQAGHHPSPMFGSSVVIPMASLPANPLPRPRPAEADSAEVKPAEQGGIESKAAETKPADAVANSVRAAMPPHATSAHTLRPPAPIPASAHNDPVANFINSTRRVAMVQRTLTEYGYGQLKPTGTVGSDTQAAIQKFERDRKIPVTGQMSDRLVRELVAMTGRPID
ncbi:MAG: peptidoglycan-binding protein [Proteobacteria bacterium]|nr:peptidoglycan-binding protein [Pseudomonadota bacterium]